MAFSDVEDNMDYFKRIYSTITGRKPDDIMRLNSEGISVREIEMLTHVSKSTVSRVLKGDSNE